MAGCKFWRNARLATMAGSDYGLIDRGAMVTDGEKIAWVGQEDQLPPEYQQQTAHDFQGALVTPGLIDCHTHLVYGGHRAAEFEQRLKGVSYVDIARRGGGINSTVRATRSASDTELIEAADHRGRKLMADGVTTFEIKSGYGLTRHDEARMLRTVRALEQRWGRRVQATYLAAHALPVEFEGRPDEYISAACDWLPALHAAGLVDAVDAFCERIGFSLSQTRRMFEAARSLKIPVKLHAEQLSNQGGAELAAEFQALSCDHVEYLSPRGVEAMAAAGCVAVLLPGAFYFLRENQVPPIDALRAAGVPIAIATDHNPGTSPALSLTLMMNLACTLFRLTPEEALRGTTVNAARALGLSDRGALAPGKRADFAAWSVAHPSELSYWIGGKQCLGTWVGGS